MATNSDSKPIPTTFESILQLSMCQKAGMANTRKSSRSY